MRNKNENQNLKQIKQDFCRSLPKIWGRRRERTKAALAAAALAVVFLAGCGSWRQQAGGAEQRAEGSLDQRAEGSLDQRAEGSLDQHVEGSLDQRAQTEHNSDQQQERLCVTTTLFPYYDFVRQIAGDRVKLKLVVPAGMDSHSFEPTPADMIAIQNSDIFFYNGGEMEQWVEDALESIGNPELRAVSMMDQVEVLEEEIVEGMEEDAGHDHGHDHAYDGESFSYNDHGNYGHDNHVRHEAGHDNHGDQEVGHDHRIYEPGQVREIEYDEHIWTSPVNAMRIVEAISSVLIEEDPQHRSFYEENTRRYLAELAALDQEFLQVSADRKRDMIVVGDKFPFRYLAETYDFQYRAAFAGCSSDTEPSARTIAYLIDQVRERQLPVVYYLELSSHRVAEIIGEETGAVPLLLHSCHNVTRQEFEEGITYLQLMEQNVKNLRAGLAE